MHEKKSCKAPLPKQGFFCYYFSMIISYYGISCFKLQSGDTVLALDPFSKESSLTPPRFQADIVLFSHQHPNHANKDTLSAKNHEEIFFIESPGEYEIHGVKIRGVPSFHDTTDGRSKGKNTVYVMKWEGLRIIHMGDYGEGELREDLHEAIGTPDILFIPVGGKDTIDAEAAAKFIHHIEPRIIIPMHYKIPGLKEKLDSVEVFLKEMGEKLVPEEKLTIKKSGVPSDSQKIVLLKTP